MIITHKCSLCQQPHTRDIDISQELYLRIELRRTNNQMIQDLIPHLTADEREFFITGAHPKCWDELFAQEK